MRKFGRGFRRWLIRLALIVVLPLVVILAGLWYWCSTSLPQISGTIALDGLNAPVEIMRDKYGIPHIFAQTDSDALFALGYVHAQDRLWQMEQTRRAGTGRLSEIFGPATLTFDRISRTLGLGRAAEAAVEALDPQGRALLDAYCAGVNAYIRDHRGAWPPEFLLLGTAPEPWRPADSLVWGELMAVQLSGHWRQALLRARLLKRLSPEQVEQLWPPYPDEAPVTLAGDAGLFRALPLAALDAAAALLDGRGASNAWVVDGAHSETGKPILANDPHLGFSLPILWYLATIETPDLHLAGVTTPGVPVVVLGHNDRIAWGMTTTTGSVEDLFIERLDSQDVGRYQTPEGPLPFRTRAETIAVHGAPDDKLTVRETRHGPVLSDLFEDLSAVAERGTVIALSATWLQPGNKTAEALMQLNRARDWSGFTAALKDFGAPEQNLTYADVDGNIGFYAAGLVPIRKAGDGRLPVPGWSGEYDWTGFIPFEELPHGFNPASGRFLNANNRVTPPGYPYLITRDGWDQPYRAERIAALLDATPKASLERFAAMQADSVSLAARDLLPFLAAATPTGLAGQKMLERLKSWDGVMDRQKPEPLVFSAWLRELNRGLFADRMGEAFGAFWGPRASLVKAVFTGHPEWCAKPGAAKPAPEDCRVQSTEALDRAMAWLAERYGRDPSLWRWGDAHRAEFRSRVLDHLPMGGRFIDIRFPADGGDYTLNRGAYDLTDAAEPFDDIHGAGYRAIYDLADLGGSQFIIATGESGNPLSRHFGDLSDLWRRYDYLRLDQSHDTLAHDGEGMLTLRPR
jgi:penicillin G amidase